MACATATSFLDFRSMPLLPSSTLTSLQNPRPYILQNFHSRVKSIRPKSPSFKIQASKLPSGVEMPKVEPKFRPPFNGFTKTAEIWNSRACMIGLIGTFIVELILKKGILEIIGVNVGQGLDIPL